MPTRDLLVGLDSPPQAHDRDAYRHEQAPRHTVDMLGGPVPVRRITVATDVARERLPAVLTVRHDGPLQWTIPQPTNEKRGKTRIVDVVRRVRPQSDGAAGHAKEAACGARSLSAPRQDGFRVETLGVYPYYTAPAEIGAPEGGESTCCCSGYCF